MQHLEEGLWSMALRCDGGVVPGQVLLFMGTVTFWGLETWIEPSWVPELLNCNAAPVMAQR